MSSTVSFNTANGKQRVPIMLIARACKLLILQALAINIMRTRCFPLAVLKETVEDIEKKSPHPTDYKLMQRTKCAAITGIIIQVLNLKTCVLQCWHWCYNRAML